MKKADIGLIGLAVMGENLAMNMENKGFTVAVFNRETEIVDKFINGRGKNKNFIGAHTLKELVEATEKPRKIMMMIRAGAPVDEVIEKLIPLLDKGDIIIARKVKYLNTNGDYILESYDGDEWLPSIQFARVINKGGQVIITPLNIDNEKCYVPERLTEEQYLKKYKNKYSIIRLIRDYTK